MMASDDILQQMLVQEADQLSKEVVDAIAQASQVYYDPSVCELVNFLSSQEDPYVTYSHV